MAEIQLHFGADGHVIVPATAEFTKMALSEGDFVICTIPMRGPGIMEPVAEQLRDMLDERGFKNVRVILLAEGITLQTLTEEELADLGLRRI